ncbi:MAG: hypothetical protein WBM77_10580 [Maribacter sp.]
MYRLSLTIIVLLLGVVPILGQSPHGEQLKMDCVRCHNPSSWSMNYQTIQFDHDKTDFQLEGTHQQTDCKLCHSSMVFDQAPMDCVSCHTDVHSQSVGNDCMQCHDSETWLVDNIPELHEENGFPLIGSHSNLSCVECHTSETSLRFDRIGNECISCHQEDYASTQNPNHVSSGYSTDCIECHNPLGFGWDSESIIHDFFPLTQGHDIQDCNQCHTTGNYADASPECVSCHQNDYDATSDPNHATSGFSTDCVACHTTNPGWTPATINHDFFPLTLGHDIQDCTQCHATGNYADASPECISCHQNEYDATSDPNHSTSGFSTDCVACHTTNPGWTPATVNHDFFPLTLGHDIQDCTQCHTTGNYTGLSPDCVNCHQDDYDQTNDPNHMAANFPTDCVACHTTNPGWTPAEFDHDGQYFPIYTGKHREGEAWNDCVECHANPASYADFTCFTCHGQSETDNDHSDVNDYEYVSTACLQCHPDGNN